MAVTLAARILRTVSVSVLSELFERVREFGPRAFLVTVSDDGSPHVVSVPVERHDDGLTVGAGRTSRANATARPAVSLVWPPLDDGSYSLIVDGSLEDGATLNPTAAVLHRVAGAPTDLPSCVRVLERES
jgi:hypothetical protein